MHACVVFRLLIEPEFELDLICDWAELVKHLSSVEDEKQSTWIYTSIRIQLRLTLQGTTKKILNRLENSFSI